MKGYFEGIIIIIVVAVISFAIMGMICLSVKAGNETVEKDKDRFVKIEDEDWGDNFVMYDKKTKVQYFVFAEYKSGGGITVLVDAEGKPLLYEED